MPRYFFNIMEGHSQNLVRDIEGALLSGAGEARKEAVGLARDITRHGIHEPTQTWKVIVTDESGDEVFKPHRQARIERRPGHGGLVDRGSGAGHHGADGDHDGAGGASERRLPDRFGGNGRRPRGGPLRVASQHGGYHQIP
jgi:hypothetical protein